MKLPSCLVPVFLGLLLLVASCETSGGPVLVSSAVSPEAQDLALYVQQITSLHKNAFSLTPRKAFKEQADQAVARLDALARTGAADPSLNLYCELSRLAALVGDSHTTVSPGPLISARLRSFPLGFSWLEGRWFLGSVKLDQASFLGGEVRTLNGLALEEVLQRVKTLVGHDNPTYLASQSRQILNQADALEYLGVVSPGGNLVVGLTDGRSLEVTAALPSSIPASGFLHLAQKTPPTGPSQDWYRWQSLGSTLFVQYNRCQDWGTYPMTKFTAELLSLLRQGTHSKVVVDLRSNGGGNSAVLDPFIDALAAARKTAGFKLYALVGPRTFSSAILNASDLATKSGAILVGEPTGGSLNHYGEVRGFTLPKSGIEATYSTKYFVMDPSAAPGSLLPRVTVVSTVADVVAGRDPQLDYCLKDRE